METGTLDTVAVGWTTLVTLLIMTGLAELFVLLAAASIFDNEQISILK